MKPHTVFQKAACVFKYTKKAVKKKSIKSNGKVMPEYKHRQIGTIMICALGLPALIIIMTLFTCPAMPFFIIAGFVLIILATALVFFYSLTTEVKNNKIILTFGPGILRKTLKIEDINNVQIVRNSWYYGWGIRSLPKGTLYSVSGFDAVEIKMHSKFIYTIGTNDPHGLLNAVLQALKPN